MTPRDEFDPLRRDMAQSSGRTFIGGAPIPTLEYTIDDPFWPPPGYDAWVSDATTLRGRRVSPDPVQRAVDERMYRHERFGRPL